MSVFLTFLKKKPRQGKMAFLRPWGLSRDAPPPPPESVRTDGRIDVRSYADVITKFSRFDGLPIFLTHGARRAEAPLKTLDSGVFSLSVYTTSPLERSALRAKFRLARMSNLE